MISLSDQIKCVAREIKMRESTITIPLWTGQDLLIEERDLWVFSYWRWSVRQHRNTAYLYRREGNKTIHFHRQLIAAPSGFVVDHVNGNALDNRRSNLRLATIAQNNWNRAASRDKKSGYFGVDFHKKLGYFRARLKSGDAVKTTYHKTAQEAALSRDAMAMEAHGEFACLNFPRSSYEIECMKAVLETLKQQAPAQPEQIGLFGGSDD